MLRIFYIFFYFVIAFFIIDNKEAQAACTCECVNGQKVPLCSSSIDIRPMCMGLCPLTPPNLAPLPSLNLPPLGTKKCTYMQVYDPMTKRYEWENVCY